MPFFSKLSLDMNLVPNVLTSICGTRLAAESVIVLLLRAFPGTWSHTFQGNLLVLKVPSGARTIRRQRMNSQISNWPLSPLPSHRGMKYFCQGTLALNVHHRWPCNWSLGALTFGRGQAGIWEFSSGAGGVWKSGNPKNKENSISGVKICHVQNVGRVHHGPS